MGPSTNKREKIISELGLFSYFLLKKKEPERDAQRLERSFYRDRLDDVFVDHKDGDDDYMATFSSYIDDVKKDFHEFRLMRLNEYGRIETKFKFYFPVLKDEEQHIFFARDLDCHKPRMIEIQKDSAFLYECDNPVCGVDVELQLVKELPHAPLNLAEYDAFILYSLFSPNLQEFIDVDQSKNNQAFVIKNTFNGRINHRIARTWLPVSKREDQQSLQAKFITWEDNDRLRILDINQNPRIEEVIKLPFADELGG